MMAAAALAFAATTALAQQWVTGTELHVYTGQGAMTAGAPIRFGANMPEPYGRSTPGVWHREDLKPLGVPADAKAAFLTGNLIITHGTTAETAMVTLTTRRVGDNTSDCSRYLGQAIEAHVGGGQRSGVALWVPLVDGEFEWCWRAGTTGTWPTGSAYGANLVLQAWTR